MKKFYKVMAAMLAMAFIVASPMGSLTAQAKDTTERGERPSDYGSGGGTTEEKSEPAPAPAPKVENSGSSNESYHEEPANNNAQSNNAQPKNDPNDVVTSVQGGQPFRSVMDKEHTQYDVYHKGINVASFSVTDKDGNKVEYKTVALEKDKDGLWYLNITFAEGVDVKDLVLNLLKGDLAYLAKELGITGIQINGEVVVLTNPETANTGTGTESSGKKTEEKKTEEKNTDTTVKEPAGYRVCWCGEKIAIENVGGLSASEKADWKAHASAHLKKGESTSYTDIANKNASK